MAMKDQPNPPTTLTPKLRFPEFREGPGWEERPFDELYTFKPTNTLSRDKLNYERGTIRNIHYGDIHTRFQTLFDLKRERVPFVTDGSADDFGDDAFCTEGDLIFADASEDLNDVGKSIEVVALHGERVLSGTHTILATRRGARFIVGFGGYLFRSERMRQQIRREAQGSKVYGISPGRLADINVCFPAQGAEQRKIAACLTSLDELLAAEGRKLEALAAHKKGLMQQLFPRQGESRPGLRFPEFHDAGEWEEKSVGDVFKVTRGEVLAMPLVKDERSDDAPYPVYSSQTKNVGLAGYFSDYLYEDAITWTTDGANAGDVNYRPGKFYCTNVCGVLISDKGFANPCTAALINSVSRQHVSYVGNPKLMNGVMAKIQVPFPSLAEQRKVAACLTSLDAVLAGQSRKVEALKQHKKGLMQQLFPLTREAEA